MVTRHRARMCPGRGVTFPACLAGRPFKAQAPCVIKPRRALWPFSTALSRKLLLHWCEPNLARKNVFGGVGFSRQGCIGSRAPKDAAYAICPSGGICPTCV
ncbi:hypothetical protein DQ04_00391000 [Trypanosoma grayi]|uniref:hypothetical protein n=1 Tax=Trypanosoma grayi TaxID=71804 RepID=UPI0004F44D3B|nr:hypothetical protein DQ04_00391000 [Trypanosoma grayi]KEG14578.1 hypothetical protein DQ04_00391000 [Trypanosoma grayi]